jgi:hypothetical protein
MFDWRSRIRGTDLTPAQRAFFESPDGVQFLKVLMTAALFVMSLQGGLGVAMVRAFFTLARLHTLVACSETTLRKQRDAMIRETGTWGDAQDKALAKGMPTKDILACVDENFHDDMMLVGMDARSGFLLLEKIADRRDGETWSKELKAALAKWPVRLVALIGDEAKGLIGCAKVWLGVDKGSDLFHVLHTLTRGTARPLARRVERAVQGLNIARAKLDEVQAGFTAYQRSRRRPGRQPDWHAREANAIRIHAAAERHVVWLEKQRDALREAVRGLGDRYHLVDLETGAMLTPEAIATRLQEGFDTIRACVSRLHLDARSTTVRKALTKAERVLPSLLAMARTSLRLMHERIAELGLSTTENAWVMGTLLPAIYLDRIVPQGRNKDVRTKTRQLRDTLVQKIQAADSPWTAWCPATRKRVLVAVQNCVDLFVRTSSPVEGRNGQLSLHHHRTHHLSEPLLKTLTVIHNYVLTRADGTTAAERFTGKKPDDLFGHLLDVLPFPARPRVRKSKEVPPLLATG